MKNESRRVEITAYDSPEVQEIVRKEPGWILRWGIPIIFFIVLILLFISWLIRYPDILSAKVEITSIPPTVSLVTRSGGWLVILLDNEEMVTKGDVIGFIRSNADPASILQIEKELKRYPDTLNGFAVPKGSLGDLESDFADVRGSLKELQRFRELRILESQSEQLRQQELIYFRLGKNLEEQRKLVGQELVLANTKFSTDSVLFIQKVTAPLDYAEAKVRQIQQARLYRMAESSVISNEVQLNQVRKQLIDLELRHNEEYDKLGLALASAINKLKAAVARWKETYLITSPCNGKVAHLGFLESECYVEAGREIFTIIPEQGTITARAELPVTRSGKVKVGQAVNIRLDSYPFEEYGVVKGIVKSVSVLPQQSTYFLRFDLPQGLQTTRGNNLEFKQKLTGSSEIITEDIRLLERFLFHFRKLIQQR